MNAQAGSRKAAGGAAFSLSGGSGPSVPAPPLNLEAEQALLGALLSNNRAFDTISPIVRAQDFADGAHARIFERIAALIEKGQSANAVTLKNAFERDEGLAEVGGIAYLAKLQATGGGSFNVREYARSIADLAVRRQAREIGLALAIDASSSFADLSGSAIAEGAAAELSDLGVAAARAQGTGARSAQEIADACLAEIEGAMKRSADGSLSGAPTGLRSLDDWIGGFQPGDLIVIGGRPSMGKTALAEGAAWKCALAGQPVFFASAEMRAESLFQRRVAREMRRPVQQIQQGRLSWDDFKAAADIMRAAKKLPLRIDDKAARRLPAIAAEARKMKRSGGLALIVVDYLQLLRPEQHMARRDLEIGAITAGLKSLASDLEVPCVLLSQLSRASLDRDNRRPGLSDLRESGSIEQDADVVIFCHREAYYLEREEPAQKANEGADKFNERYGHWQMRMAQAEGKAELIIDKYRNGRTGSLQVAWDGPRMLFFDGEEEGAAPGSDEYSALFGSNAR